MGLLPPRAPLLRCASVAKKRRAHTRSCMCTHTVQMCVYVSPRVARAYVCVSMFLRAWRVHTYVCDAQ